MSAKPLPSFLALLDSAFSSVAPDPGEKPEDDNLLVIFRQIHRLAKEAQDQAELSEHQARQHKLRCMATVAEVAARIEMREAQLGVEHGRCSECGETCVVRANGMSDCCGCIAEDL